MKKIVLILLVVAGFLLMGSEGETATANVIGIALFTLACYKLNIIDYEN